MTDRRIPLHEFQTPDPKVTAWLHANDVDPNHAVAASYALIVEEKLLAFVGFHVDDKGKKSFDESVQVTLKVPIVVPMKSAPEDHGL